MFVDCCEPFDASYLWFASYYLLVVVCCLLFVWRLTCLIGVDLIRVRYWLLFVVQCAVTFLFVRCWLLNAGC